MANVLNAPVITQRSFLHGLAENTSAFALAGRVTTGAGGSLKISGRAIGGLAATLA